MINSASSSTFVDTASRLRAAFARPVDEATLKAAVCGYADEGKRLGWPVERVIIDIKRISEAAHSVHPPEMLDRIQGQRLLQRVVTWCVEHYYRANPRPPRPEK